MPIFVREVAMLATLVLVAVMFISCNNNVPPDVEGPPAPSIIGYWKLKYFIDEEGNKRDPDISKWLEYLESDGRPGDSTQIINSAFWLHITNNFLNGGNNFFNCCIPDEEAYFIGGVGFVNGISGRYSVDYNTNILSVCAMSTLVANGFVPDGEVFEGIFRGLNKTYPFEVSENTLLLYYNDGKECLEFYKIGGADE